METHLIRWLYTSWRVSKGSLQEIRCWSCSSRLADEKRRGLTAISGSPHIYTRIVSTVIVHSFIRSLCNICHSKVKPIYNKTIHDVWQEVNTIEMWQNLVSAQMLTSLTVRGDQNPSTTPCTTSPINSFIHLFRINITPYPLHAQQFRFWSRTDMVIVLSEQYTCLNSILLQSHLFRCHPILYLQVHSYCYAIVLRLFIWLRPECLIVVSHIGTWSSLAW